MEILTGEQMRRVDRRAIDGMGIPSLDLMEAAGRGICDGLLRDYPTLKQRGIVILCGKGNNGGDGLVVARHLAARGIAPRVLLFARAEQVSDDAAVNLREARSAGVAVREIHGEAEWARVRSTIDGPALVLDALLGTGVRGGARGLLATVIDDVNASECSVAAVDLPSGVDADSTTVVGCAVFAERTYTLCRPKPALVLGTAANHCGTVEVIPIGIPDGAVAAEGSNLEWLDLAAAGPLLRARTADSHKGTYGHLLAVAGSAGKSGAAVLLARGALRSGVGLVTVATSASARDKVAVQQAEIMTETLDETSSGGLDSGAARRALDLLESRDALALGPGLGTDPETCRTVREIVACGPAPAVIDADGLNALAADGPAGKLPAARPERIVLTPHPGEAARLLGGTAHEVQADRLESARRLSSNTGSIVLLKGHRSLVAAPDGRVAVNSSGNPGMATAGSGDVLTGIVGALLARGLDGWDAARFAVFVHGAAGDRAAADRGEEGLIASDIVDRLPETITAVAGRSGTDP